jgi:hypothetical protein
MRVNGIYKNGQIKLTQLPQGISEAVVSVIFYPDVSLSELGIDENAAADLRHQFAAFTDWEDPLMNIYDDYDTAKAALRLTTFAS